MRQSDSKYFPGGSFIECWIYSWNIDSSRYNCWLLVKNENRTAASVVVRTTGWSFTPITWEELFTPFYIISVLYKGQRKSLEKNKIPSNSKIPSLLTCALKS